MPEITIIVSTSVNVKLPTIPNFLTGVGAKAGTVSIADIKDSDLQNIADNWGRGLLAKAEQIRLDRERAKDEIASKSIGVAARKQTDDYDDEEEN